MAPPMSLGYWSADEYPFREDQADAIARVASYRHTNLEESVIWFPPHEHRRIGRSISTPFPRAPKAGLGSLGRLPLELLRLVFLHVDMYSLFRLRQTNRGVRQAVDWVMEYQIVVSHGLNLFCALLRTGLAIETSLSAFYEALCTKSCVFCGGLSTFISLLTWTRTCFQCFRDSEETKLIPCWMARDKLALRSTELDQLKSFTSLPGTYATSRPSSHTRRVPMVSLHQAVTTLRQYRVVEGQSLFSLADWGMHYHAYPFMGTCALPHYDKRTGRADYGVACAGCRLGWGGRDVFINDRYDRGLARKNSEVIYTQEGFLEHFKWCKLAQWLWVWSDDGTKRPAQLPAAPRAVRRSPRWGLQTETGE